MPEHTNSLATSFRWRPDRMRQGDETSRTIREGPGAGMEAGVQTRSVVVELTPRIDVVLVGGIGVVVGVLPITLHLEQQVLVGCGFAGCTDHREDQQLDRCRASTGNSRRRCPRGLRIAQQQRPLCGLQRREHACVDLRAISEQRLHAVLKHGDSERPCRRRRSRHHRRTVVRPVAPSSWRTLSETGPGLVPDQVLLADAKETDVVVVPARRRWC